MAVQSPCVFIQAGSHPAEDVRRALYAQLGLRGGIIQAGDLAVTQNGTPNMTVNVATGQVVVPGTEGTYQGAYICENRGSLSVTIAAADATNPRYDLIVARVRDAAYSGATNTFAIEAVTGTPAASPAEPTIPANSWVLARVEVVALDTTITTSNIVDRRTTGTGQFGQASALGGKIICTSTTRPTAPFEGMVIYETDTDYEFTYSGSAWVQTSHLGALTSYTPTWVQSSTISKTVTYAKSMKLGRWCQGSVLMTATSAGVANNAITVTAPYTAAGGASTVVGAGWFQNAALDGGMAIGYYSGILTLLNSTTFALIPTINGINAFVGQAGGSNFDNAIASDDRIGLHFAYETAS